MVSRSVKGERFWLFAVRWLEIYCGSVNWSKCISSGVTPANPCMFPVIPAYTRGGEINLDCPCPQTATNDKSKACRHVTKKGVKSSVDVHVSVR